MKKILSISIIMLAMFAGNTFAQKTLTLTEAISVALNQNTSLIKSKNSIRTQEAAVKSAYGSFLPSISAGGSWSWQRTNDNGGSQLNYFGEEEATAASEEDSRSFSLSANSSITLFDGLSSFAKLSQTKNSSEAAKYDLEQLRQDVVYQTANLFFSVISYDKLLKYQEENYKYNENLLQKISEMNELKMNPISDVYSQEVQTANSESDLLQAQNNFEKAKISLLDYLSLDINQEYTFEAPSKESDSQYINEPIEQLYETALANRKDYQSQKLTLESANDQLTIANAGYLPSLNGSFNFSTSALTLGNLFSRRVLGAGISLNVPVFSGWSTDYSVQSAKVQIENSNEDLRNLERTIKSDVKNVMLDLQTAKKQVEVTNKAIQSAQESWKVKKESYSLGKITYIDLQSSYKDLLQAQNNSIQALYTYYKTNYELMNKLGVLDTSK